MTLAEFLLARIAEDESLARAAATRAGAEQWRWFDSDTDLELQPNLSEEILHVDRAGFRHSLRSTASFPTETVGPLPVFVLGYAEEVPSATAAHIIRWDAEHVLAECEAKRRIVDLHVQVDPTGVLYPSADPMCQTCHRDGDEPDWPCATLQAIALPYAEHPDYDESWRP